MEIDHSTQALNAKQFDQAVHKDPPLALIEEAQREAQFLRIYKKIKEAVEA